MRLELAGSLVRPDPLVIRYDFNDTFDTLRYIELGYTHFEAICIGGGGGMGGGIDAPGVLRSYGGAGGGGGFHQTRGLLSALPNSCSIVVGQGGAVGTEHVNDPAQTTNGANGGVSTFNTNTCRASGGEGGKRVQSGSATVSPQSHGGAGGAGNRSIVGGGAAGGVSGTPSSTPNTAGTDGTFINNVGKGGGGGAGGVFQAGVGNILLATAGGRGSYNPGDTSVYGPEDAPNGVIPGGASGAKASPLNGLPTIFGRSKGELLPGDRGVVILRLTAE